MLAKRLPGKIILHNTINAENAMNEPISIIIPALNESRAIADTVRGINTAFAQIPHEIIVVDDGSSDDTGPLAAAEGARIVRHPEPGGYGLALKAGIKSARHDLLAIVDADGTYPLDSFPELYRAVMEGNYDMAVGARTGRNYDSSRVKAFARRILKLIVEFSCGRRVADVNSGMRVFRKSDAVQFLPTLSNTFSFTTSITLAFMINGLFIKYVPIRYNKRQGESKVRHIQDSLRALQLIVHSVIYYNPIKIFLFTIAMLLLSGVASYAITFFSTNLGLWIFATLALSLLILSLGFVGIGLTHISIVLRSHEKSRYSGISTGQQDISL